MASPPSYKGIAKYTRSGNETYCLNQDKTHHRISPFFAFDYIYEWIDLSNSIQKNEISLFNGRKLEKEPPLRLGRGNISYCFQDLLDINSLPMGGQSNANQIRRKESNVIFRFLLFNN